MFSDSFSESEFGAHVVALRGAEEVSVLSRPADAMAFALRIDAPILVASGVVRSTAYARLPPDHVTNDRVSLGSRETIAVFPREASARLLRVNRLTTILAACGSVVALLTTLSIVAYESVTVGPDFSALTYRTLSMRL